MKKTVKRVAAVMMAFLICISMTACVEKQSYAEFDEGTQHVVFKDLEIDIPSAWVMDEEESTDNSVWYHKNVRSVTQSMFYMSSGQTKEDFDAANEEDKFFDQYLIELGRSEGVTHMSEPKASEFAGNQMRYVTYDQDISHHDYKVQTYLILKGKTYYNITFGTFVDNEDDFAKSFETLEMK